MMRVMVITLMMMVAMKKTAGRIQMKDISVGPNGVWGVDSNNQARILTSRGTRKSWDLCFDDKKMIHVDVGTDISWGTGQKFHGMYYLHNSNLPQRKENQCDYWWKSIVSHGYVTVSPSGHVWELANHDSAIWSCNDCAGSTNPGRHWSRTDGAHKGKPFKQISAGISGLWGVDNRNDVYYMENTYGDKRTDPYTVELTKVGDLKMTHVSSARHHVYGISRGGLYMRLGMSSSNPTGTVWQHIFKDFSHLTVVDALEDEEIWVIDTNPQQGSYAYVGSLVYDVKRVA